MPIEEANDAGNPTPSPMNPRERAAALGVRLQLLKFFPGVRVLPLRVGGRRGDFHAFADVEDGQALFVLRLNDDRARAYVGPARLLRKRK